jgi:glycosyltransferase involved in cell wall biosynthesis
MRIAFHVPRASWLEPEFSGDQAVLSGLLAGLRKRGHQVRIASRLDALHVCRGRVPARRLVAEAFSIWMEMKRFSPDAWLVYTPSVTYPDLFGWWHRARRYAIFAGDSGRAERLPGHLRWLYSFAHRRSLRRADKVSAYRPRAAARLRALGVAQERLCILPPPVRIWDWLPSREEARRHLGLPETAPVILCVSRFTLRRKDGRPGKADMLIDLLAAVAPLATDVVLVLVGDGAGRPQVEAEAAKLKPDGRVRLVGHVPDVRWFYAACDVFAYPYRLDRPWVALLEAQACGRPVVTMRTDSGSLIVQDGRTGLLAADLDEFQAHLKALVQDRARREEMGKEARQYAASFHSTETRIAQIENLLLGEAFKK